MSRARGGRPPRPPSPEDLQAILGIEPPDCPQTEALCNAFMPELHRPRAEWLHYRVVLLGLWQEAETHAARRQVRRAICAADFCLKEIKPFK